VLVSLSTSDEPESLVELTVLDNGQGAANHKEANKTHEAGYGLLGIRERVALLGGTVMAGPGPAQGWHVEVTIPLTPPVALGERIEANARPTHEARHEITHEARDEGVS
jgi:glucose-6-phosphate-specific signal transduction histidine kinase